MNEVSQAVKGTSTSAKLWGVVTIILGILAMGSPFYTGMAVAIMIGAILIVSGIAQTLYALQAPSFGKVLIRLLFGGITVVAGIYSVTHPGLAAAALSLALAIYFLVDGVFMLIAAFQMDEHKGWFVFNGLVTLILGIMLWRHWPLSGILAIGILVGIRLIFSGMMMVAIGSAGSRVSRAISQETD